MRDQSERQRQCWYAVAPASALHPVSDRPDGGTHVTYDGHPLYRYSGDTAPGDTNGQGVGSVWFAMTADGTVLGGSWNSSEK